MRRILFQEVEQPLNGLLVVLVLLALDDDLLAPVDEPITTLLGEILLSQDMLSVVDLPVSTILVLLGNAIGQVIL